MSLPVPDSINSQVGNIFTEVKLKYGEKNETFQKLDYLFFVLTYCEMPDRKQQMVILLWMLKTFMDN